MTPFDRLHSYLKKMDGARGDDAVALSVATNTGTANVTFGDLRAVEARIESHRVTVADLAAQLAEAQAALDDMRPYRTERDRLRGRLVDWMEDTGSLEHAIEGLMHQLDVERGDAAAARDRSQAALDAERERADRHSRLRVLQRDHAGALSRELAAVDVPESERVRVAEAKVKAASAALDAERGARERAEAAGADMRRAIDYVTWDRNVVGDRCCIVCSRVEPAHSDGCYIAVALSTPTGAAFLAERDDIMARMEAYGRERDAARSALSSIAHALGEPDVVDGAPPLGERILSAVAVLQYERDGARTGQHEAAADAVRLERERDDVYACHAAACALAVFNERRWGAAQAEVERLRGQVSTLETVARDVVAARDAARDARQRAAARDSGGLILFAPREDVDRAHALAAKSGEALERLRVVLDAPPAPSQAAPVEPPPLDVEPCPAHGFAGCACPPAEAGAERGAGGPDAHAAWLDRPGSCDCTDHDKMHCLADIIIDAGGEAIDAHSCAVVRGGCGCRCHKVEDAAPRGTEGR